MFSKSNQKGANAPDRGKLESMANEIARAIESKSDLLDVFDSNGKVILVNAANYLDAYSAQAMTQSLQLRADEERGEESMKYLKIARMFHQASQYLRILSLDNDVFDLDDLIGSPNITNEILDYLKVCRDEGGKCKAPGEEYQEARRAFLYTGQAGTSSRYADVSKIPKYGSSTDARSRGETIRMEMAPQISPAPSNKPAVSGSREEQLQFPSARSSFIAPVEKGKNVDIYSSTYSARRPSPVETGASSAMPSLLTPPPSLTPSTSVFSRTSVIETKERPTPASLVTQPPPLTASASGVSRPSMIETRERPTPASLVTQPPPLTASASGVSRPSVIETRERPTTASLVTPPPPLTVSAASGVAKVSTVKDSADDIEEVTAIPGKSSITKSVSPVYAISSDSQRRLSTSESAKGEQSGFAGFGSRSDRTYVASRQGVVTPSYTAERYTTASPVRDSRSDILSTARLGSASAVPFATSISSNRNLSNVIVDSPEKTEILQSAISSRAGAEPASFGGRTGIDKSARSPDRTLVTSPRSEISDIPQSAKQNPDSRKIPLRNYTISDMSVGETAQSSTMPSIRPNDRTPLRVVTFSEEMTGNRTLRDVGKTPTSVAGKTSQTGIASSLGDFAEMRDVRARTDTIGFAAPPSRAPVSTHVGECEKKLIERRESMTTELDELNRRLAENLRAIDSDIDKCRAESREYFRKSDTDLPPRAQSRVVDVAQDYASSDISRPIADPVGDFITSTKDYRRLSVPQSKDIMSSETVAAARQLPDSPSYSKSSAQGFRPTSVETLVAPSPPSIAKSYSKSSAQGFRPTSVETLVAPSAPSVAKSYSKSSAQEFRPTSVETLVAPSLRGAMPSSSGSEATLFAPPDRESSSKKLFASSRESPRYGTGSRYSQPGEIVYTSGGFGSPMPRSGLANVKTIPFTNSATAVTTSASRVRSEENAISKSLSLDFSRNAAKSTKEYKSNRICSDELIVRGEDVRKYEYSENVVNKILNLGIAVSPLVRLDHAGISLVALLDYDKEFDTMVDILRMNFGSCEKKREMHLHADVLILDSCASEDVGDIHMYIFERSRIAAALVHVMGSEVLVAFFNDFLKNEKIELKNFMLLKDGERLIFDPLSLADRIVPSEFRNRVLTRPDVSRVAIRLA